MKVKNSARKAANQIISKNPIQVLFECRFAYRGLGTLKINEPGRQNLKQVEFLAVHEACVTIFSSLAQPLKSWRKPLKTLASKQRGCGKRGGGGGGVNIFCTRDNPRGKTGTMHIVY